MLLPDSSGGISHAFKSMEKRLENIKEINLKKFFL